MNRVRGMIGGAVLMALLAIAGPAHAEPAEPVVPADPAGAPLPQPAAGPPPGPDPVGPVAEACKEFDAAMNLAAVNYEEFAYATAGNGNNVNYQDPVVEQSNVVGRTALRAAAGAALDASRTPGLPPEVSDPMQSWSMHATKLLLVMGLRGGGDRLNSAAAQLNTDADNAMLACALARQAG